MHSHFTGPALRICLNIYYLGTFQVTNTFS